MKIKWGRYNFFYERKNNICTKDLEKLKEKNITVDTNVFQFIKTDEECNVLIIDGEQIRIRDTIDIELPEPKFKKKEKIYIKEKDIIGRVITYIWHSKEEKYFYILYVNGKKKSRRYFENELQKVK
ncbi:hypothetical protein [Fusobacterium sp. PH5-44]|uniref:hypothetical protein n=1 Tax=unclassified Fusobacterium TaxID=2648384 RepID=UPI003D24427C